MTIKSGKKNYQPRNYKEISKNTFKKRYTNHKRLFNINRYKNVMKLSIEYYSRGHNIWEKHIFKLPPLPPIQCCPMERKFAGLIHTEVVNKYKQHWKWGRGGFSQNILSRIVELKSRKFQPKGNMGSEKTVYCIKSSIKEMFSLFEWEARNIRRQRKQFIKQKVCGNMDVSSSKELYVTNSCIEDPKPWGHI